MSRARDVVEVVARALTDHPDKVEVLEIDSSDGSRITVKTGPGDLGKLIGRQGRTATAVRALADVTAEIDGRRATVDLVDD